MKVTLSWLGSHLAIREGVSDRDLANALSLGGAEATVSDSRAWAQEFGVARVEAVEKHPQAEKLSVCQVAFRGKTLRVVCGAQNVRAGLVGVLALPGQVLPGAKQPLAEATIRGIKSEGMLCSADELKIGTALTSPDGILDLPESTSLDATLDTLLPKDPLIDMELTPNRGDMFCVRGVARELAALGMGTLKPYPCTLAGVFGKDAPERVVAEAAIHFGMQPKKESEIILETEACSQFSLCALDGVQNGIGNPAIAERLCGVGMKSISTLVDVTNYLCHDIGRPLHVFDAEELDGPLVVRLSREGERFEGLDDEAYTLPAGLIVIADKKGIVSLAGIMGSKRGACQLSSTRILVESALFDPIFVSRGGQRTGIVSDARTRFERGVDPALVIPGLRIAVDMMVSLCGGRPTAFWRVGGDHAVLHKAKPFSFRLSRVQSLGGGKISDETAITRLKAVGCGVESVGDQIVTVSPPSWRHDLVREEDAVEEVLRMNGYAEVPGVPLLDTPALNPLSDEQKVAYRARRSLVAEGFFEVVTYAFMSRKKAEFFCTDSKLLDTMTLRNPCSQDLSVVRPSLLPNLLDIAVYHERKSVLFAPVFESAPQFWGIVPGEQTQVFAGLMPLAVEEDWVRARALTVFDVKGVVERFLEACSVQAWEFRSGGPSWYHPGRCGTFVCGEQVLAVWGEVHPRILQKFDTRQKLAAFEVFIPAVMQCRVSDAVETDAIPTLQPVTRDMTFVLSCELPAGPFLEELRAAAGNALTALRLVDVFDNAEKLGEGKKSLAIRVEFQPAGKAFSDADLHSLMDRIIHSARAQGAELRGQWE